MWAGALISLHRVCTEYRGLIRADYVYYGGVLAWCQHILRVHVYTYYVYINPHWYLCICRWPLMSQKS